MLKSLSPFHIHFISIGKAFGRNYGPIHSILYHECDYISNCWIQSFYIAQELLVYKKFNQNQSRKIMVMI
jgi:hypothetical protein